MRRRSAGGDEALEMQMGPMIDMVFLLLVFFMVTATPMEPENDIRMTLPGTVAQDEPVDLPDEQRVRIDGEGNVYLNDLAMDTASAPGGALPGFTEALSRIRLAGEASGSRVLVTLAPDDAVPHQRVVDVLDACAAAGVNGVSFSDSGDGS